MYVFSLRTDVRLNGLDYSGNERRGLHSTEVRGSGSIYFWVAQRFLCIGALFGPCMTKWYQFLNQIKFPSPTKALIYRLWLDQAILTPGVFT